MTNALSIDVEDYFHPTEVQASHPADTWNGLPSRVEQATRRTLGLLARHDTKATCFVLGWVARRFPALIAEIAAAGHEIGCHSFWHRLVYDLTPEQFRDDTREAMDAITAACGLRPRCYRAPSYSITGRSLWALDILAELGFTHDSSIYPIRHDRYGIPGFPRSAQPMKTPAGPILEIPIATVQLSSTRAAPVGGGGYLRMFPYAYTAAGIRRLNDHDRMPACIYFHPWEIDPDQPRVASGAVARLRTYLGLAAMESKLDRLLSQFSFAPIGNVYPAAG
jgi:polysaccharide deacetylase family protein (PEP-CTERM system associated)